MEQLIRLHKLFGPRPDFVRPMLAKDLLHPILEVLRNPVDGQSDRGVLDELIVVTVLLPYIEVAELRRVLNLLLSDLLHFLLLLLLHESIFVLLSLLQSAT